MGGSILNGLIFSRGPHYVSAQKLCNARRACRRRSSHTLHSEKTIEKGQLTAVGHGQREGPVVPEVSVELVLELSAPDGLAAGAVPKRISLRQQQANGEWKEASMACWKMHLHGLRHAALKSSGNVHTPTTSTNGGKQRPSHSQSTNKNMEGCQQGPEARTRADPR